MARGNDGTGWAFNTWPKNGSAEGQDRRHTPASKKALIGKTKTGALRLRFDEPKKGRKDKPNAARP